MTRDARELAINTNRLRTWCTIAFVGLVSSSAILRQLSLDHADTVLREVLLVKLLRFSRGHSSRTADELIPKPIVRSKLREPDSKVGFNEGRVMNDPDLFSIQEENKATTRRVFYPIPIPRLHGTVERFNLKEARFNRFKGDGGILLQRFPSLRNHSFNIERSEIMKLQCSRAPLERVRARGGISGGIEGRSIHIEEEETELPKSLKRECPTRHCSG